MTATRTSLREPRGPRRSRGIAVVEFVITAPFLLLLLLAGAELGRAFVQYATLSHSIRDSARFVSDNAINGTTGVVDLDNVVITQARNLAVYGNIAGTGNAKLPNYQPAHVQVINAGNSNIRVTASYPYQPMLGITLPTIVAGTGPISQAFNMQVAVTMRAIS
jgi:Flp pilus assembly protein TadG